MGVNWISVAKRVTGAACGGSGSVAGDWSRENTSRELLFVVLNVSCHDVDIGFSSTYAVLGAGARLRKRNREGDSTCARARVFIRVTKPPTFLHCLLNLVWIQDI